MHPPPAAQRWRELRLHYLPFIVYVAAAIAAGLIWREYVNPPTLVGQVDAIQTNVSSTKSGTLPFTGFDLRWTIAMGVVLMGAGFGLLALQRRQRRSRG